MWNIMPDILREQLPCEIVAGREKAVSFHLGFYTYSCRIGRAVTGCRIGQEYAVVCSDRRAIKDVAHQA